MPFCALSAAKGMVITMKTNFDDMTMPDAIIPGKAMPTIFAYDENGEVIFSGAILEDPEAVKNIIKNFRKRPGDLLKNDGSKSIAEQADFIKKFSDWSALAAWSEYNSAEMKNFRNSIIDFTNAIFSDKDFANRLKSAARDSDEIVFCIGYLSYWNELDAAIYELIFKCSILGAGKYEGKKSSIIMVNESKAVFFYSKDIEAFGRHPEDGSVLIMEIGSSIVNIMAMAGPYQSHSIY